MRIREHNGNTQLWLSASDTETWATRPGASWPCSQLRGKRVYAEFARNGDLVDLTIDGKSGVDVDVNEFNACTQDYLTARR